MTEESSCTNLSKHLRHMEEAEIHPLTTPFFQQAVTEHWLHQCLVTRDGHRMALTKQPAQCVPGVCEVQQGKPSVGASYQLTAPN